VDADASGANNGWSWADAYNYLQDALADASSASKPVEVRVAGGTYKPDEDSNDPNGTGDRTATFQLKNAVPIKGGYAGFGAPDPNLRNFDLYESVLSGDLNGDDAPGFANYSDNAYHVVCCNSCDNKTILDGFTITSGCADGQFYESGAAGMLINSSDPIVTNCIFRANLAVAGAGLINIASAPLLRSCAFSGNSAYIGGAFYNQYSSPTLINCTLSGNFAVNVGGIYNSSNSSPTLTSCILWANQDDTGSGEIAQIWEGTPSIDYSCIQGWTGALGGTDNSGSNPLFIDADGPDDTAGTEDDNLRLKPLSPCIDAGEPNYAAEPNETDVAGNPRLIGGCIDMGAYESDYLEVNVRFTPTAFNPGGEGNWFKLHFVLSCILYCPMDTILTM
jgi:hypothetical protein